jgi:hypothetical protein
MRLPLFGLAIGLALTSSPVVADTIAQFSEKNGGNDFVFTPGANSAIFATISGGSPVSFLFTNAPGAPVGIQDAHAFLLADTTLDASIVDDNGDLVLFQPFSHFELTIRRDSDNALLLGVNLSVGGTDPADLVGLKFDHSAGLAASTAAIPANAVLFTSDFYNFAGAFQSDAALSFSSIDPQLFKGPRFLEGFAAAATGTFSSIPEPVSLTLVGLAGLALIRRRLA